MGGTTWMPMEQRRAVPAHLDLVGRARASGEILEGHQLQPAETATTVRLDRSGQASVTDGPFVEGKEMVGGYAVIDVPDLDAAIKLMSGWPAPDVMEIRPVVGEPPA